MGQCLKFIICQLLFTRRSPSEYQTGGYRYQRLGCRVQSICRGEDLVFSLVHVYTHIHMDLHYYVDY